MPGTRFGSRARSVRPGISPIPRGALPMDQLRDDAGRSLERFRPYLDLLARLQVGPALRVKVDLSGVVQQALLEAYRGLPEFRGRTEAQTAAWLRQILRHNLADELRRQGAQKRDA